MGRPKQRMMCPARQYRPSREGFSLPIGISFLLLFPGCAQLDQMMDKQAAPTENSPVQATEPVSKSSAKKKRSEDARPASAAGMSKQPEPALNLPDQDKGLADTDQSQKEKKSHVASDKKKKPARPHAELQPPTEDVFLPPVPLPSKPAAIGGSGG